MTTRANKKSVSSLAVEDFSQFGPVLFLNKNLMDHSLKSVKLRHPKYNSLATYLCCEDKNQIYEIFKIQENFRSWLIDDLILKDGSVNILTQVNPVYFLLPSLLKNKHRYVDLSHLLDDDGDNGGCGGGDGGSDDGDRDERMCSDLPSILNISYFKSLDHITSCENVNGKKFYKFEPEKALDWLKTKVKNISQDVQAITPSVLPGFESQPINDEKNVAKRLKTAWELVSEYLPESLSHDLALSLNICVEEDKNQKENSEEPLKKKCKLEGPLEDYSINFNPVNEKTKKLTASQRSLEKVDKTGIKSISSFFTKPIKKKS